MVTSCVIGGEGGREGKEGGRERGEGVREGGRERGREGSEGGRGGMTSLHCSQVLARANTLHA